VQRWQQTASAADIPPGIAPSEIPDEDAEILDTGELRIFVQLTNGLPITGPRRRGQD
jgi:hypothetical protein